MNLPSLGTCLLRIWANQASVIRNSRQTHQTLDPNTLIVEYPSLQTPPSIFVRGLEIVEYSNKSIATAGKDKSIQSHSARVRHAFLYFWTTP